MFTKFQDLKLGCEVLTPEDAISANMTDFAHETTTITTINKYDKDSQLMCKPEHTWWTVSQGKIKVSQLQDQYAYRAFEIPLESGKTYNIWFNDRMDRYYKAYNCFATDDDHNVIKNFKDGISGELFLMSNDSFESDYSSKGYSLFNVFTMPEGATRLCFSCNNGAIASQVCVKEGTWRFPYVEYREDMLKEITYQSLEDVSRYSDVGKVQAEMTDFVKAKRTIVSNLYDKETMHSEAHNWWIFSKNKAVIQKLDDRYEYWAFDIPVKENQDYTIWYNLGTNYWCQVYNIIAVDDEYHVVEKIVTNNFTIIEHINHITDEEAEAKNLPIIRSFRVPEHATRLLISLNSEKLLDELCLNEGIGKSLPYEPYQGTPKIKVEYTYSGLEDVVHGSSLMKFQLPESINILPGRWAGDKGRAASYVDLFYNESVIGNPINSNLYKTHVKDGVYCYSYAKYCNLSGYTLGHNVLTLDMYDEHLNKIVTEQVNINVLDINNIHSPETPKNILMVGDSLTQGGVWCKEFMRMLTSDNGSPIGLNLTNFNTLGSSFNGDVNFEGVGGWEYSNYNTNYKNSSVSRWFNCANHGLTSEDIMAVYKESTTNEEWRVVDVKTDRIKLHKNSSGSTSIPDSGNMIHVSGGVSVQDISYDSTSEATANPFWNEDSGKVDFRKYVEDRKANSLDYCYVLLGWNCKGYKDSELTSRILTFINNIHQDYPNCQIMLIGLQRPSHDGCGSIRSAWNSDDYYESLTHSIRLNELYKKIADENNGVYYVHFASFFDSEHGYPTTKVKANSRSSTEEYRQSNNVHPNTDGQMQLADVVLRDFLGRI